MGTLTRHHVFHKIVSVCTYVFACLARESGIRFSAKGGFKPASSCGTCRIRFRAVQPHQQQMFTEESPDPQDGEQPGPSRRKRQPSMSETMPLYTLCKEDLESMDKEVSPRRAGPGAPTLCAPAAQCGAPCPCPPVWPWTGAPVFHGMFPLQDQWPCAQ